MKIYKYFLISFFIINFTINGAAQNFKPSIVPDRIILTWKDNPTTTQAVTWRTDKSVSNGIAEIVPAEDLPRPDNGIKSYLAETTVLETESGTAHFHSVNFINLEPENVYAYRVGYNEVWSEWFQFRTASRQNEPFSFIYFGDAQNDVKSLWSRVIRQASSHLPEVSFMVHAGDLVNFANSDDEWGEWFYAGGWLYGMIPSIPTPGNHEYTRVSEENKIRYLSKYWSPQFALPENGPENFRESVFYIDYQGVRIISLNSMEIIRDQEARESQANWLVEVLKDNPNKWTCVTFHHPVFSSSRGRDNIELRETFQPIFDRFKVDLVLQGHDHTYGRGQNITSGVRGKENAGGTMYVVSVSGPKMYSLTLDRWMDRAASETQLYQIIKINDNVLSFAAYTPTGKLYDAFDLVKQSNGENKLIEKAPDDVPERVELHERYRDRLSEKELKKYEEAYGN